MLLNPLPHNAAISCTIHIAVENIVRNREIACNKQFLLFSQCFLPYMVLIFHFKCSFKMSSAICFNLDQSKILSSGNGLIRHQHFDRNRQYNEKISKFKGRYFLKKDESDTTKFRCMCKVLIHLKQNCMRSSWHKITPRQMYR